ncbi:periplasmic component of efflux system [Streptococcus sp. DD10]|uniref:efflux RND transporter periplasmic adaptor subunit n=1 Tax=Streptococcus sp. DD10 TaxID=1777878 RepID=UPI0007960CFB|nr:efflux RND transporter periplasmic adaptor subunit [Streptococcus sp. DD10]KXT73439.1 periplasmic component of efflux system [Streptococcus sp. DD10]
MKKTRKLKKWQINSLIGAAASVVVIGGAIFIWGGNSSSTAIAETMRVVKASQGEVASSVLLSGAVKAGAEQYVYYDSSKGDLESVYVNVGDEVYNGQAIAQYRTTDAQVAYDSAVRAQNRIARQINELQTTGVVTPSSQETTGQSEGGEETQAATAQTQANAQSNYNSQLADLQSSYADATDNVTKAWNSLNATTVLSTVDGTVVEVNRDVSKSTTGSSQTIVHIVNNGSLQVEGELSEYNLPNLHVGQEVTMTSKVYPDKTWTGTINYISEYPKDASAAASTGTTGGASGGAKYPFRITFTSDIAELKQGFSMNIEVKNANQGILVPVSAILSEDGKNYVWTIDGNNKAKKVEVTLGVADAENQTITAGLTQDEKVIANPTPELQDGKEVGKYEETN